MAEQDAVTPGAGPETQAGLARREALIGGAALVIAVGCLVAARGITAAVRTEGLAPSAWPTVLALGMIALAVTMLVRAGLAVSRTRSDRAQEGRARDGSARDGLAQDRLEQDRLEQDGGVPVAEVPEPASAGGRVRVLASLGAFVVYGVVWQWVDFRVCTVGLIAALAWIGGGRGWRPLLAFPIGLTAVLWALFGLGLEVPL